MGFVQSLYNAVSLCAHDPNIDGNVVVINVGDAVYVSPVEASTAFWYGSHGSNGDSNIGGEKNSNGLLYAWVGAACANFDGVDFIANDEIRSRLTRLQPLLMECLGYRNGGMTTKIASHARRTRTITDNVVRYATVPMVQNLVHHLTRIIQDHVGDGRQRRCCGCNGGYFDRTDFVVKDAIGSGLMRLQPLLTECLGYRNGGMMTMIVSHARRMRTTADDVVRYATCQWCRTLSTTWPGLCRGWSTTLPPQLQWWIL
jgi:hypothetical protein